MRFVSIAILVMLVITGCATQSRDRVIDRVSSALEKSQVQDLANHKYRIFPSHLCVLILLPSNTPPAQVATEALKTDFISGFGSAKALHVRKTRILSPEYEKAFPDSYDPMFTAVLMDTAVGLRVVLLQYHEPDGGDVIKKALGLTFGHWEHWTIDPEQLFDEVASAAD